MSKAKVNSLLAAVLLIFVSLACSRFTKTEQNSAVVNVNTTIPVTNTKTKSPAEAGAADETASTSGAEKTKPAAGKGNVQGKVLYNDQPVAGIEVRICENFSTIMGIKCDGKSKTVKTGADGVFVLADLDPMTYGGLAAKVFKSNYYLYPYEGYSSINAKRFNVEADKTIYSSDIHLFKDDIKTTNPKAGAKVAAQNLELKWDEYPDADYYKVTLYPDAGGLATVNGERVDDPLYSVTETLTNGKYRMKVEAYNAKNHKLAENNDDIKFTVTGGAEPAAKP